MIAGRALPEACGAARIRRATDPRKLPVTTAGLAPEKQLTMTSEDLGRQFSLIATEAP